MTPARVAVAILALALGAVSCKDKDAAARKEAAVSPVGSAAFQAFVEDYFHQYFTFYPSAGTAAGLHEYDTQLESFSEAGYTERIGQLQSLMTRLQALRAQKLTTDELIDGELLDAQMQAELLDIAGLRLWRRNPMPYVSVPGNAIDGLMKREFAPGPERLRSVIARIRQAPALLANMRANITESPREFVALARRMAVGSVGFFRDTVPAWAKQAAGTDTALLADFNAANRGAIAAFEQTVKVLDKELPKRPSASYAIGSEAFMQKLRHEEMVDIPLPRLLEIGEANLEKDSRAFIATARQIDASKSAAEVMADVSKDHPSEADLIPFAKKTVESAREFIVRNNIIEIPSDVRPTIAETPPYARSGSFASMDTPGAYEKNAKEAFYYITPPEKEWTASHKTEHLRLFNRPVMDIVNVHEAYPGHYVQFLYAKQFPTKTRKLVFCGSNAEGWAHYTEQMMIEEGFGGGDPKLKLAQLSEALLRDCRYVAGIKLHTQKMTVEQAARLFVEKGFQEPANAYEEARRGAYNPTYLYYTLGKLQIYKLREDYRKAKGKDYSLSKFHSDFVRQGGIPIKLMRRILLPGDNSPTL